MSGFPEGLLDDRGGQVFLEVLPQTVRPQVERVDGEAATEHPVLPEVVGHPHPRLEVVGIAAGQRPGGMQQALPAGP